MHGAYLHGGAILGLAVSGYLPVQWFEEDSAIPNGDSRNE
jgi:hypothetical protein